MILIPILISIAVFALRSARFATHQTCAEGPQVGQVWSPLRPRDREKSLWARSHPSAQVNIGYVCEKFQQFFFTPATCLSACLYHFPLVKPTKMRKSPPSSAVHK